MTKLLKTVIISLIMIILSSPISLASPQDRISECGAELFYENFKFALSISDKLCHVSDLHHLKGDKDVYAFTISRSGEKNVDYFIMVNPEGYISELILKASLISSNNIFHSSEAASFMAAGIDYNGHLPNNSRLIYLADGSVLHHYEIYDSQYNRTTCLHQTFFDNNDCEWVLFPKTLIQ